MQAPFRREHVSLDRATAWCIAGLLLALGLKRRVPFIRREGG